MVLGGSGNVVTMDDLDAGLARIEASEELRALRAHLLGRSARIIRDAPEVPTEKALLSRDGGTCPEDGAPLAFDPWSPASYRCTRCGRAVSGERHRRHWARFQHLWLAEQAAQLAALGAVAGADDAASRAAWILAAYANYDQFPNRDNVLGPARLFFSTYLESIWLTDYLASAVMLREQGRLDEPTGAIVSAVADEAATIIGEFDEGLSNRQVWHDVALAAVAVWFEDAELAEHAIQGPSGLLSLVARGIGGDGLWHEGENYHLFALQGILRGVRWAQLCGMDLPADPDLAAHLASALRAPMLTALPDGTFPARKDARFGVSLAQPMYLELWETGLGLLDGRDGADTSGMADWLRARYADPAPPARLLDSWLYEAGEPVPAHRDRTMLSWHVLLGGLPALPDDQPWQAPSILMPSQGLAVLRRGGRYVSLECGPWSGGHGHPDRLQLTLHERGVHWLPDPGAGSYVDRDLFWYRSTLAHNAPQLDGHSQSGGDAHADAFEVGQDWSWVQGSWGDVTRTIVSAPSYLLDVVQLASDRERTLEVPYHLAGTLELQGARTPAAAGPDEFVSGAETVERSDTGTWQCHASEGDQSLRACFAGAGELVHANGPGLPGGARRSFLLRRGAGRDVLMAAVLATAEGTLDVSVEGSAVTVEVGGVRHVHAPLTDGWEVAVGEERVRLGGRLLHTPAFEPLLTRIRLEPIRGVAHHVGAPPALDGTLAGFDTTSPLDLDHDDQYRRSESPYAGPDAFSATAYVNWDRDAMYVAALVRKDDPCFRSASASPLALDNETDDLNSDGLQLYLADDDGSMWGILVVPEDGGGLRVHAVGGSSATADQVAGSWQSTDDGYCVTLALRPAFWTDLAFSKEVDFDLLVNEMWDGRARRAGQLVWSGGGGWVYLRGDRQDPEAFGIVELA